MIDPNIALEAAAGAITAIGGVYTAVKKWIKHSADKKEKYKQDILSQARSETEKFKVELEEKIEKLETEIETQKQSIYKDIGFLKESYSNEIKNLTEKIDNLRDELKTQHTGILSLLTKLIDGK
jgi:formylmethanofuran:tetrahydromethanopterin formyltransferase